MLVLRGKKVLALLCEIISSEKENEHFIKQPIPKYSVKCPCFVNKKSIDESVMAFLS